MKIIKIKNLKTNFCLKASKIMSEKLDVTIKGFEICNLMKEKIPYFDDSNNFILIDKNDIFCNRYLYDDNIKHINDSI